MREMGAQSGRGLAFVRAADAMLQALGGGGVQVLFPGAGSGGAGEELGFTVPPVEEVEVAPVCRVAAAPVNGQRRVEFLFSAAGLARYLESRGSQSAQDFFNASLGIVEDGMLMRVESVVTETFAGTAYLHRVIAVE
jgi:hypothetical protein